MKVMQMAEKGYLTFILGNKESGDITFRNWALKKKWQL